MFSFFLIEFIVGPNGQALETSLSYLSDSNRITGQLSLKAGNSGESQMHVMGETTEEQEFGL